ncbi:hypothetical protein Tco_0962492 [Tanacetum coccineum]
MSSHSIKETIRLKNQELSIAILDINHFRHFLVTLENLYPMDDEPMWAADRVVALTLGSLQYFLKSLRICILRDTENEAVRLMMFPISLTGEAKNMLLFGSTPWRKSELLSQHENESLTDAWLRMKEML